ncbi:MAG: VOC family protein [Bdellovibrionia bacterium]
MFDHVFLNVSDKEKSSKFYTAILKALGVGPQLDTEQYTAYGTDESYLFWLHAEGSEGATRNMHLALSAPSRKSVDEFYRAGLASGGKSNGEPGLRPEHGESYYAAFLLDPDGNNIEAVCYK